MEVRIKKGNGYVDAEWTIENGVMVVLPKKFEPKDGDVIVGGGETRFVAIFNMMRFDYSFFYYALLVLDGDKRPQLNSWASFLNVRPASEDEKKLLFDKLAEEGWEWKADTKELVKLKWKPKEDEIYFLPHCDVSGFHVRSFEWEDTMVENQYYKKGWIYKTEQECQEFCNRLNEAINQVKP